MRFSGKLLFSGLCAGMLLTGCVQTSSTTTVNTTGIAMNQTDSDSKIQSLCNAVIMQSGGVSTAAMEYTSPSVEYNQTQIDSFISTVETAESEVESIQTEANSFTPAAASKAKLTSLKTSISSILKDLSAFKNAAIAGDTEAVGDIYDQYSSDLDVIRQLASS